MTDNQQKGYAVIAYITIIGSIISISMNSEEHDEFVAFHSRQGLGMCVSYMLLGYIVGQFNNLMISGSFAFAFGLLALYGVYGAVTKKQLKIPIVGDSFQNVFKMIGRD